MKKIGNLYQKLHKEIKRHRLDNRGAAIILVIIAMGMIGILASTLLWMSYMNYRIKINDIRNKNTFYSAETVMEQIMAGVQQEASVAVAKAYGDVLTNWDSLGTESKRYEMFTNTYLDTLTEAFKDNTVAPGGGFYYDREKLKKYVDTNVFLADDAVRGVDYASWKNGNLSTDVEKKPVLEMVNNNSLILRNIYVSYYEQEQDRVSVISTDICIDVPRIVFSQNAPDILYEYLLIGGEGVEVEGSGGTITADGSIYAGTNNKGKGGILINPATTFTVDNGRYVISGGDITVVGPQAGLVVRDVNEDGSELFAKNLDLKSGMISLDSRTYIANDLTLSGNGSKATFTKEYYGYGTSTDNGNPDDADAADPEKSSAIIINGKYATIDMSRLNRLMLAGRAYIGQNLYAPVENTDEEEGESGEESGEEAEQKSPAVMMGESIAIKGGQIAYLVPAECLGVPGAVVGQNPVTQKQTTLIDEYKAEHADFYEVDFNKPVYRLGGKTLSEFGITDKSKIRTIHTQYLAGENSSETLTYYYLVFDKDNSAKYFNKYYNFNSNKAALDHYFETYAKGGIRLGAFDAEDTSYTILGNSMVSDILNDNKPILLTQKGISGENEGENGEENGENEGGEENGDEDAFSEVSMNAREEENAIEDEAKVLQLAAQIEEKYTSLNIDLTENASLIPNATVFTSLIKENGDDGLLKFLDKYGTGGTYVFESNPGETNNVTAVLTKNSTTTLSNISNNEQVRVIVSTGDVVIDEPFTGQIIAKGKITVKNSAAVLKRDKNELYKALSATKDIVDGSDTYTFSPLNFFVNGTTTLINGAEEAKVDEEGNLDIQYADIVRYVNWVKK